MINRTWGKRLGAIVGIALLVGLLPLLTAALAGPDTSQAEGQPADLVVSAQDTGGQIQLATGQVLAVRLRANPSTGYLWQVVQVDEQILRPVGSTAYEPDSDLLGAPGTVTLRFQPVAAGKTDLALIYHRPWEKEGVLADFSLEVTTAGGALPPSQSRVIPSIPLSPSSGQDPAGPESGTPATLPSAFNWCDQGGCTPVKDQGSCGSCWAFATVGPLESWIKLSDGVTRDLSEQYLVSCNTDGWGCDGGWWAHDYHEWKYPAGEPGPGAVYEADFPYAATDTPCNPPHIHHEKIADWVFIGGENSVPSTDAIKQAILDHGPVSVALCVNNTFKAYTDGVFNPPDWCSTINHAVVLVGWDDSLGAWRLRNSWGPDWGEDGYMWIAYGKYYVGYSANYVVYVSAGPPAAPSNLRVTSTSQTLISLAWDDSSSNESGFKIERSPNGISGWIEVGTVAADVTIYTDTGLALSTTYYYRVSAYNASGDSAPSNVVEATTHGEYTEAIYLPLLTRNDDQSGPVELLQEGFEEGEMPPPGGWSTIDTNRRGNNWMLVNRWTSPDYVHTGDHAAWVQYDARSTSDEWLLTPPVNLSGASGAALEFWGLSDTNYCSANVLLHVTDVGGTVVDTVWDMCADESWADFTYRLVTVDLSAYSGQTFKLAWQYVGANGQSFGLDDVLLYTSGTN